MSVPFQEIGGSPVEQYGLEGFTARRQFLLAWEDRDAFAAEVLGRAVAHGSSTWAHYPGKASVFAVRVRYEPFDPNGPDAKPIAGLTEGLNSYNGSFAKAIVDYRTVNAQDRPDGPSNEIGTHLTYRMLFAAEDQPILPTGWRWIDDPAGSLPADLVLNKRIPVTEHHLTWHQVIQPPWDVIQALQGKVNEAEFLGAAAGTLLFEGAEANKLFRAGFESGPSEFCWQIRYVFLERAIKHGGAVYGWNHVYRGSPPGWVEVTNGSDRLYDAADFSPLFRSASTS